MGLAGRPAIGLSAGPGLFGVVRLMRGKVRTLGGAQGRGAAESLQILVQWVNDLISDELVER
jgi:hypothetical protein